MPPNIPVRPSISVTAVPVKTDTVSGAEYQVTKLGFGADGAATHVRDATGARFPVGGEQLGAVDETAPATDTAASGHNGRLQRIAQRITALIALIPVALGQGTMAQSFRVVLPSDQSTLTVNQSKSSSAIPAQANVTTTAGSLVAANAARRELIIRNLGPYPIYLGQSAAVTAANGIPLYPRDTLEDDRTTQQWFAIAEGGTSVAAYVDA